MESIAAAEKAHFRSHGVYSWKLDELIAAGYSPVASVSVQVLYVTADGSYCIVAADEARPGNLFFINERRDEASAERCR